jgi:hypothetical protein
MGIKSDTIIFDDKTGLSIQALYFHPDLTGLGVLKGIGECFAHDVENLSLGYEGQDQSGGIYDRQINRQTRSCAEIIHAGCEFLGEIVSARLWLAETNERGAYLPVSTGDRCVHVG